MATAEECQQALEQLAARMTADHDGQRPPDLNRSVACVITDLDTGFRARLAGGTLTDITRGDDPEAQITLTVSSDDLVALTRGELDFTKAWTSGRVKVNAGVFDLIKLRKLL
ncbi:MAG TPA: alkyl sulfatase C-terminal domain-containing protein [Cryptosporangiaceae bacterium]|nr:alkyl sulfatase C-terminal domain-containing protein [Cryptosporangiaceae bacterium]